MMDFNERAEKIKELTCKIAELEIERANMLAKVEELDQKTEALFKERRHLREEFDKELGF